MPVELRPHQIEGVQKMHNGCILYGDVGVGKTITSLGYYFERVCGGKINKWGSMKTPKDVYVITTAKVRDGKGFELTAAKYGIFSDPEVSTNGVKITVDSWNNIHKYLGVENAFFIFDEQRVVGYGAWSRSFIRIAKANEWILLSATPGDTWLDYIPVFIANGWYKHKTDFIDQHVIWTPRVKYPKVQRYQNVGVLVRRRNQVLVHMPYERHTVRHPKYIYCDYDTDKFEKVVNKKWHVYEDRPLRDVAEQFSVMRKVVNSDSSRLEAVRSLMQTHPKLIVFYNFDYELEMLRELGASLSMDSQIAAGTKQSTTSAASSTGTPSPGKSTASPISSGRTATTKTSANKFSSNLISAAESVAESAPNQAPPRKRYSSAERTEYSQSDGRSSASESSERSESQSEPSPMFEKPPKGSSSTSPSTKTQRKSSCSNLDRPPTTSSPSLNSLSTSSTGSSKNTSTSSPPTSSGPGSRSTSLDSAKSSPHWTPSKATLSPNSSTTPSHISERTAPMEPTVSSVSLLDTSSATSSAVTANGTTASSSEGSFAVAEWNGHKHEDIPTTERWLYLVQYRAGAEGWDCIETDAIVFFSQTYSYRDWWQAHGRIDRLNTPFTDLHYYHFVSRSMIDAAIRKALKTKKNFNERDLVLPKS